MKSPLFLLALAASVPLATPSTVVAQNTPKPVTAAPANGVAATVNGETVPLDDLNRMVDAIKASDPAFKTNSPATQKALAEIRTQMLDEMINTRLLSQEAQRRKITAPVADVDKAVANLRGGFKSEADFQKWLKDDGKTPADLRKVIADELSIRELSKQLTADVTVSNDDIAKFYREHLPEFTLPEAVRASHILLAVNPNSPPEEKARVKKRASDLLAKLKNGGNWNEIAKNNTDDPTGKTNGGNLGFFTRGRMVKAFEDAAFSATVGKIVGPIETDFGMHIIRVDEKVPAKVLPLADVQKSPEIKAIVLKEKVQTKLDASIAALKTRAQIKKFV